MAQGSSRHTEDVSIHAAREGGDKHEGKHTHRLSRVSIHAAREGGDNEPQSTARIVHVSIHAAREGGDSPSAWANREAGVFQSTPPARAATPGHNASLSILGVSIHAAREGGDFRGSLSAARWRRFNPRRPRGRRHGIAATGAPHATFQSTPPARAATRPRGSHKRLFVVSIHAAREGGDRDRRIFPDAPRCFNPRRPRGRRRAMRARAPQPGSFNPRRPRGRRPDKELLPQLAEAFQSTPPARAATDERQWQQQQHQVSIHAAREGGDHG